MGESFKKDFAYAMTPMKILSWPVGTWPLQDYDVFSSARAVVAVLFLLLMLMIIQTELYLDSSDAEKNLDATVLVTCGYLAIAKVFYFRVWPAGLISNFTSAVNDYNEPKSEEKRAVLRRHAYMGRVACASVIGCSYFGSTLFMTVPMLAGDEEEVMVNVTEDEAVDYPIPSKNVLEAINMPQNLYFVVFVTEYIMLLLTSTGNLGMDSLFFGIIFHLCGQVEVLKMDFSRVEDANEETLKNFNVLVKRHIYLIRLADMLNDTISSVLVFQLFTSCVLICTTGFQCIVSLNVGNLVLTIKAFIVVTTLLVQLFGYSYVGDYLKEQMEGIGHSVYICSWYDLPRNVVKNIIYVIMRAQDPVHLTAGRFFIVNLQTYMSIVKTSMSYLSVLRVMVNA